MTSLVLYSIPLVIYAFVAKWNSRSEWRDIAQQLGLVVGQKSYYWWALGFAFLGIAFAWVVHFTIPESIKSEQLMAMSRFVGERLTATNVLALFVFGMIETGLGEELFFRGLIAGWLGRRQKLWVTNVIQAAIFTLPHLLVLTVDMRLWPLAVLSPFVAGLMTGWLRLESGSIVPGWLVHGLSNVAAAIFVML